MITIQYILERSAPDFIELTVPGLWSRATHCNAAGLAGFQYKSSCALLLLVRLRALKEILLNPDRPVYIMRGVSLIYGFIIRMMEV